MKKLNFSDLEDANGQKLWWEAETKECNHCYKIPGYNLPPNFINLLHFRRQPMQCVDIGANVGTFAAYASPFFSNIYSIEAVTETYKAAVKNLSSYNNVTIDHAAAWSTTGQEITVYMNETQLSGDSSCYLSEKTENMGSELVKTISLPGVYERYNIDYIDYLKIDCEGAEYDFLIDQDLSKINFLVMEIHPGYLGPEKTKDLLQYLEKYFNKEFMVGEHILFYESKKNNAS